MPGTSIYNLRYQIVGDSPNGAIGTQDLAEDVETQLARIDAALTSAVSTEAADIAAMEAVRIPFFAGYGTWCASNETTTTSAWADLIAPTFAITKEKASTYLKVELHASFASSNAATSVEFGVQVHPHGVDPSTDTTWLVAPYHQALPAVNVRLTTSGLIFIPSLAAGLYEMWPRWRRSAGSGTVSRFLNDDWIAVSVTEVR